MQSIYDIVWEEILKSKGLTGRNKNGYFSDLFSDLVVELNPDLVLEVGAFEADFSMNIAGRLNGATVIAFEANPHVYKKFKNEITNGVEYVNNIVSSDTRQRSLFIPRKLEYTKAQRELAQVNRMSSILLHNQSTENDEVVFDSPLTIDNVIKAHGSQSTAIWLDVEGAAGEVLFGAKNALSQGIISTVYVELEKKPSWDGQWIYKDVRKLLTDNGFDTLCRDFEAVNQFNEIYVHQSLIDNVKPRFTEYVSDLAA